MQVPQKNYKPIVDRLATWGHVVIQYNRPSPTTPSPGGRWLADKAAGVWVGGCVMVVVVVVGCRRSKP